MADVGTIEAIEQIYMFTKVGTIVGSQNWSETSFHSTTTTSGGGGYMHQGSGFISPGSTSTTTSSSTAEQLRLFVREDDGEEFEAKFSEPGFGVREGHRVTIVYAGDQGSRSGYPMALANHSTGQSKVFDKRELDRQADRPDRRVRGRCCVLCARGHSHHSRGLHRVHHCPRPARMAGAKDPGEDRAGEEHRGGGVGENAGSDRDRTRSRRCGLTRRVPPILSTGGNIMRLVLALIALAACSMQASVYAQTAPKPWPREVQAVYDQLKQDCRTEGGKFVPDRAGFATQVEVTNDGKPDWVIEYAATRCTTSGYSAWCGTAGCVIGILGSTKNGLREIYNDNVRGWDVISVDAKRKGLMLLTHGSVCGGYGAEVCGQTLVWNGQKWVQTGMQRNVDPSKMKGGDGPIDDADAAPPPQHTARWQFAGTGSGAIAAVTGHPEFAAIGIRCQPGGGLYMTVVPKDGVPLPAAGHPLLLSFRSSMEDREGTQALVQEPGKGDFSGTIDPVVESLLSGRDTDLSLIASSDGGDEWKDLSYVSLGGSTAAIRALVPQCASAAGAASGAQAAGQKPVAPLGIVSGYYVNETEPCANPGFEALYYDGRRLGLMRGGGAPGSLEENFVGPLGKVEKSRGSFFLPEWEMEVKILSPTRIQLTIQDTGPPMRWCPAEQLGAKWRLR